MVSKNAIKTVLSLVIIISISFFFYKAFQSNLTSIQSHTLSLNFIYIALSFIALLMTSLLATYGWYLALNSLSGVRKITFSQSIATVNTSGLTKYIPGKIWSYGLQMYWMANKGVSKSLLVYVNLINLYISIITSSIVGLVYLVLSPSVFPARVTLPLLLLLVLFDSCFLKSNSTIFNGMISPFNKIFKCDIKYFDISAKLIITLHVIHFIAAFCFGIGAYLLCFGIGFEVGPSKMLPVMSSLLLSDVIGFLAVIVPGGLGVREGVMYLILKDVSTGSLPLILPVATRIVSMLVDMALGTVAFKMLHRYRTLSTTSQSE